MTVETNGHSVPNVLTLPTAHVEPEPEPEPGGPAELDAVLAQWARVAAGALIVAAAAGTAIVRRTLGDAGGEDQEAAEPPLLPVLAGATFGLALEATARASAATMRAVRAFAPLGSLVVGGRTRGWMNRMNDRWQAEVPQARHAATAFTAELVPEVAKALLEQIDLTELVKEQVDLDAVVANVDLDAVVERLDLDAIVARVDLDAVVARMDLGRIAKEVIDELDLSAIIRESTETVTGEAVDDLRYGTVDADRAVERVVDRIFRRRGRPPKVQPVPLDGSDAPS
jgi:hypothetical protein